MPWLVTLIAIQPVCVAQCSVSRVRKQPPLGNLVWLLRIPCASRVTVGCALRCSLSFWNSPVSDRNGRVTFGHKRTASPDWRRRPLLTTQYDPCHRRGRATCPHGERSSSDRTSLPRQSVGGGESGRRGCDCVLDCAGRVDGRRVGLEFAAGRIVAGLLFGGQALMDRVAVKGAIQSDPFRQAVEQVLTSFQSGEVGKASGRFSGSNTTAVIIQCGSVSVHRPSG